MARSIPADSGGILVLEDKHDTGTGNWAHVQHLLLCCSTGEAAGSLPHTERG
jgi:hypothetical protein